MTTAPIPLGVSMLDGETVAIESHGAWRKVHWAVFALAVAPIALIGLVEHSFLAMAVVEAALFMLARASSLANRVTVTTERVIANRGLIIKHQEVLPLRNVQDVRITQGPLASMFDYGKVFLETAGRNSGYALGTIDHPRAVRDAIHAGQQAHFADRP